jgi:hypothetical protein
LDSGTLEKAIGEALSDGTGEGLMDNSIEFSVEEDSDEDSGGGSFLDARFGRRVSDVGLTVDSVGG